MSKIFLITGAAGNIGGELTKQLAAKGDVVILHYHKSQNKVQSIKNEIEKKGVSCIVIKSDFLSVPRITKFVSKVKKEVGHIDVFINMISIFKKIPFSKVTEKDWDKMLAVDIKAPFFLAQGFSKIMKKNGSMIFFSDVAAKKPYVNYLPYCIAKGGVEVLVKGLAKIFTPKIRVNAIAPYIVAPNATTVRELASEVKTLIESETITGRIVTMDR